MIRMYTFICFIFLFFGLIGAESYYVGDDYIFFTVHRFSSGNKNNDTKIGKYIKKITKKRSLRINTFRKLPAKIGVCYLLFWKNIRKGEWGYVVAECGRGNEWRLRLNGENEWNTMRLGEEEMYKWFTAGRSVSTTLKIKTKTSLHYLFNGSVERVP